MIEIYTSIRHLAPCLLLLCFPQFNFFAQVGEEITEQKLDPASDPNGLASNMDSVYGRIVPPLMTPGKSVVIEVLGGPYSAYSWSNGGSGSSITVFEAGVYTVTVTNHAGATATRNFVVTQTSANPAYCLFNQTIDCTTKTIRLETIAQCSSTGETWPDPVLWSNGMVGPIVTLTPPVYMSYSCATDPGNVVVVDMPAFFTGPATITGPDIICPGIDYELNVNLPNSPDYQFFSGITWDPPNPAGGLNPYPITAPGTYKLTLTDYFGCPFTATKVVQQSPPVIPQVSGPYYMCSIGDSETLTVNPTFTSYHWDTGESTQSITVDAPGIYNVTVTNNLGCTGIKSWEVGPGDVDNIEVNIINPTICAGQSSMLQVIGGPYVGFSWSNGMFGPNITVNQPGDYSITVTNPYGCTGVQQVVVNPAPVPTPALASPAICAGNSTTLSVSGGTFSSYAWTGGSTSPTLSVSTPGTYTVTVADAQGCTGTASTTVQASPAAMPTISGPPEICSPGTATFQASGGFSSYAWSVPGGGSGGSLPSVTVSQTGNYVVTVSNSAGCTGTAVQAFVVNQSPVPTVAADPYNCNGQMSISANAGFSNYQWSNGATTPGISTQSDGNFTVTVTSAAGCTGTAQLNVSIPPAPATNITGVSALCPGVSGQLSASGGYTNYAWSGGLSGQNVTVTAPGTYTVTATDQFGCTATATRIVNPSPALLPVLGGPLEICVGGTAQIAVNGNFDQYQWSTGATTPGISASQSGNYVVTVTNNDGCTGTATHPLIVGTELSPQITAAPYNCNGQINLSAGAGFSTYNWSNNGGTTAGIAVSASGNYAVTVTDNTGCSGTATFNVSIPPSPTVNISGDEDLCAGTTTTLSATAGFQTYAWSGGQNTPSITANVDGDFTVTVTDQFGCTATAALAVTVYPPIMPDISGPAAICQNTNATLVLNTPFSTYQWSNGATTATISVNQNGPFFVTVTDAIGCTAIAEHGLLINPAPNPILQQGIYDCDHQIDLTCSTGFDSYAWSTGSANTNAIATASGNYVVTVSDNIGCTGTASIPVVIPADPVVSISTAQPFCLGGSGQLQASGNFNNYIWSSGQATTGITVNQAGNYAVTVTDQFGCTGTATTSVTVLPLPSPLVEGPPEICPGSDFQLSVIGGTFSQFAWSNGSTNPTTQISFPGHYTVTVTDQNGCKNSDDFTVAIGTLPTIAVGQDPTLTCTQNSVVLSGAGSSTGATFTYQWTGPNGATITGSTTLNPVVSVAGVYRLLVTNSANGCTSSATVTVNQSADLPTVEPGSEQLLTCTKTSVQLDATGTSAGPDFQYIWTASGTGNIVSGANSLNPTVNEPGIYVLQVTNTSNNCSATNSVIVTEDVEPPVISLGSPDTLTCALPSNIIQAVTVSSSSQQLDYSWTTVGGNILSSPFQSGILVNLPGIYTVVATDPINGCVGTADKTILADVNLPIAAIAIPDILTCITTSITLNAGQSSAGSNFNLVWKTQDGNFVNQSNPQMPSVDAPGEYELVVTNSVNGCKDSVLVEVFENTVPPTAYAGESDELTCKITSFQLSGEATGSTAGLTYNWTTTTGNILNGATTLNPTVDKPGVYTFVSTDLINGCTSSSFVEITQNIVPPNLSIPSPEILTCVKKEVLLSANTTGQGNAPTFTWTTTDGNIVSPTTGQTITVDQPGTYVFAATNNENGCSASTQINVEQNVSPPPVNVENPLLLTCTRLEVGLEAIFNQNLTAVWTTADGQILSGANSASPTVGKIGTYEVLVTNPADGCTNTAKVLVQEETNKPTGLDFDLIPPDCTGKKGRVSVENVSGGVQPLTYSINGGQSFSNANQFASLSPGTYDLVVKDANGCEHEEEVLVPEPPEPAVQLPPVFEIEFGDEVRLEPVFPPGFPINLVDSAFWTPLDGLVFESLTMPDLLTPTVKTYNRTVYTLTVVTPEGCTAQARSEIQIVRPHIFVPNVIQTNGPEIEANNSFTIFASTKAVEKIHLLRVFDRWGELLFSNADFAPNDPNEGWKGDFRQKPNTPAVFVWYAEVLMKDGTIEFLTGEVTVLR